MTSSPSSGSSPNRPGPPAALPPDAFRFETRVRYSEVDRMGIAHNSRYYEWFELARTELCRSRGLPYAEIEARGYFLVVAESSCRYRSPLRYDDLLTVRVALAESSPRKFAFAYEIAAPDGTLAATGRTVHVVVDAKGAVASLPRDLADRLR